MQRSPSGQSRRRLLITPGRLLLGHLASHCVGRCVFFVSRCFVLWRKRRVETDHYRRHNYSQWWRPQARWPLRLQTVYLQCSIESVFTFRLLHNYDQCQTMDRLEHTQQFPWKLKFFFKMKLIKNHCDSFVQMNCNNNIACMTVHCMHDWYLRVPIHPLPSVGIPLKNQSSKWLWIHRSLLSPKLPRKSETHL